MTKKEKNILIRKNTQVPNYVAEWLEDRAENTGMSQSSIILMALNQYIDQQKSMDMGGMLQELIDKVNNMEMDNSKAYINSEEKDQK